jgi:hypothetical protein
MVIGADFWNATAAADFSSEPIGDFSMAGHCLDKAGRRIGSERVTAALALQHATVTAQVLKQRTPFHAA